MHNNTVSKKHKQLSVLWNLQVTEHAIHCCRMKCFCCCKQVQAHNLYWVYEVSEHLSVKREASRSLKDFTFLKLWICVKKKKKTNINPAGTWVIKRSQSLKRFCFHAHFQKQHLHTAPFKKSIGFWIDFFFCFVFFPHGREWKNPVPKCCSCSWTHCPVLWLKLTSFTDF